MPPPDSELGQWFATQVQPHEPVLRAWLSSRFGRRLAVDDLMQEAYVRVLRARTDGESHVAQSVSVRRRPSPQIAKLTAEPKGSNFSVPTAGYEGAKVGLFSYTASSGVAGGRTDFDFLRQTHAGPKPTRAP